MYSIGYLVRDLLGSTASDTPEKRNEIWASDLGKPFVDRYLKMKGVPYSNPIDGEGLQNFILGKSAEEAFADLLNICKIPNTSQNKVVVRKQGCLDVTGRLDLFLGVPDWKDMLDRVDESIKQELEKEKELKETVYVYDINKNSRFKEERDKKNYSARFIEKKKKLIEMIKKWEAQYPNGLENKVAEIKTISLSAMKYHKTKHDLLTAYPQYTLQLYTYMLALGLDQGTLIFITKGMGKNYSWLEEIPVFRSDELDQMFWNDVENFSKYFLEDKQPPIEPIFDQSGKKPRINWKVTYSSYYDLLYKAEVDKIKESSDADLMAMEN